MARERTLWTLVLCWSLGLGHWGFGIVALPEVIELKRNPRRRRLQVRDHRLEVVVLRPRDPQRVPLDRRVPLQLQALDRLLDRLGGLFVDAARGLPLLA